MRKMISMPQDIWKEVVEFQEENDYDTISDAVHSLIALSLVTLEEMDEEEGEEED